MKEQVNGFDLASLDTTRGAEQGYELQLVHPKTGEALSVTIKLIGADSELYRDRQRDFQRARVQRMSKLRKLVVTPEELEAENLELLVAATTGWDFGSMVLDGQPVPPFSGEAARGLYRRFGWIREQVDQAVQDRANFLPRSASG